MNLQNQEVDSEPVGSPATVAANNDNKKPIIWSCIIIAGLGGTMPTICRLAGVYVANPKTELPEGGMYLGLALFFIIGAILSYAFSETNLRQAFVIGVCAPAIITNIVSGAQEGGESSNRNRFQPGIQPVPEQIDYPDTETNESDSTESMLSFPFIPTALASESEFFEAKQFEIIKDSIQSDPVTKSVVFNIDYESNIDEVFSLSIQSYSLVHGNNSFGLSKDIDDLKDHAYALYGDHETFVIDKKISQKTTSIMVSVEGKSHLIQLPENGDNYSIEVKINISKSNDFLWALGAKRTPKISLIAELTHFVPLREKKFELDQKVIYVNSNSIGKIAAIKSLNGINLYRVRFDGAQPSIYARSFELQVLEDSSRMENTTQKFPESSLEGTWYGYLDGVLNVQPNYIIRRDDGRLEMTNSDRTYFSEIEIIDDKLSYKLYVNEMFNNKYEFTIVNDSYLKGTVESLTFGSSRRYELRKPPK